MIYIKHIGIYVNDMELEKQFYKNVFSMKVICDTAYNQNKMLYDLFHDGKGEAFITKLITPLGIDNGMGEMIELVKVLRADCKEKRFRNIDEIGNIHICFSVDNIEQTVENIQKNGGNVKTKIFHIGQNSCTFCTDPEGNWIELISQAGRWENSK